MVGRSAEDWKLSNRSHSAEHKKAMRGRCPLCGARIRKFRLLGPDGRELVDERNLLARTYLPRRLPSTSRAECPKCHGTWPFFAGEGTERAEVKVTIEETGTFTELYRVKQEKIDNLRATTPLRRTLTISEVWVQKYEIERDETRTSGQKIDVAAGALGIAANMDEALKSRYSVSEETQRTYTDEMEFEVPPLTLRYVDFTYHRVWQHGIMKMTTEREGEIEVPFRVAIGLNQDVAHSDEKTA